MKPRSIIKQDDEDYEERMENRSKCDHKFIDSTRCLKCGWEPTEDEWHLRTGGPKPLSREFEWIPIAIKPIHGGWYLGWLKEQKALRVMTVFWNGEEWNYTRHLTHWAVIPEGP